MNDRDPYDGGFMWASIGFTVFMLALLGVLMVFDIH